MTVYSKAALKARVDLFFPDNTSRYITPTRLREIQYDIIDSYDDVGSEITGAGTNGKVVLWTSASTLADSIMSESGGVITVTGNVNITGLAASRVMLTDSSKNLISSTVTATELGYVSGVTSGIQAQLNAKKVTQIFADATARAANIPDFAGQLGVQLDNGTVWRSTGTSAGNWSHEKTTQTFDDETARDAAVPAFLGQLGFQLDTNSLYYSDGLAAGDWQPSNGATGTYTPVLTEVSGVDSFTDSDANYFVVGDSVTVFGVIQLVPDDVVVEFTSSLPVATTMTTDQDLAGSGSMSIFITPNYLTLGCSITRSGTNLALFHIGTVITPSGASTIPYMYSYKIK